MSISYCEAKIYSKMGKIISTESEAVKAKNFTKLANYQAGYKTLEAGLSQTPTPLPFKVKPKLGRYLVYPSVPYIALSKLSREGEWGDFNMIYNKVRTESIFEKAMTCSAIQELYMRAMLTACPGNTRGSWALLLREKHEDSTLIKAHAAGYCAPEIRTIVIDDNYSDDEALSIFVFELLNATRYQSFYAIYELAKARKITRDGFAKAIEAVEHENALKHTAIIKIAIKELGLHESVDVHRDDSPDFEVEWQKLHDKPRAEVYRKRWDSLTKSRSFCPFSCTLL